MADLIPKPLLIVISLIAATTLLTVWQVMRIDSLSRAFGQAADPGIELVRNAGSVSNRILVDIAGAVEKPGVYGLKKDSRLVDALKAAGGLSADSDRYLVARSFNLAKKLADEEKVYIPYLEERTMAIPEGIRVNLISLNSASLSELELLPGIGPKTAQKVIDRRPYSAIEDVLTKKAVGEKTFEKIRDLITL